MYFIFIFFSVLKDKTTKNVGEDRNDIPMEIDIYDLDDEGKVLPDRSPPATTTEEDGKNAGVSSGERISLSQTDWYCKGRVLATSTGGCEFESQPSHTKDLKNSS